jgi:hypothetical protein
VIAAAATKIREWFKVFTQIVTSPEFRVASPEARGVWITLNGEAVRRGTDGHIFGASTWKPSQWRQLGLTRRQVEKTVAAGLLRWEDTDLFVGFSDLTGAESFNNRCEVNAKNAKLRWSRDAIRIATGDAEKSREEEKRSDDKDRSASADGVEIEARDGEGKDVGQSCCSPSDDRDLAVEHAFCQAYRKDTGRPYAHNHGRDRKALKTLPAEYDRAELVDAIETMFRKHDPFVFEQRGASIPAFVDKISVLLGQTPLPRRFFSARYGRDLTHVELEELERRNDAADEVAGYREEVTQREQERERRKISIYGTELELAAKLSSPYKGQPS